MKSFYNVDGIKLTSEVASCKKELIVKVHLAGEELNFQKTERKLLFDLLPKHVIKTIEQIIDMDTSLFIDRSSSVR